MAWDGAALPSMEEWGYIGGHTDAMMENQLPLTSPDGSSTTPEICPHPLYTTQEGGSEYQNVILVMVEPQFKNEEGAVPIDTGQYEPGGNALWKPPKSLHSSESRTEEDEKGTEYDEGGNPRGLNVIVISETGEEEGVAIKEENEITYIVPDDLQKMTSQGYGTANETHSKDHLTVWKSEDVSGWGTKPMAGPNLVTVDNQTTTCEKPFSCTQCGALFTRKSSLNLHQRIHSGENLYSCPECGKQFVQKANFLQHQRTHLGEKQYKCTECAQMQSLVMQQNFNPENVPSSCSQCGASFIRQTPLVNQKKTNEGLRCYICTDCGDVFTLRSSLVNHQKVHSAEKDKTYSK